MLTRAVHLSPIEPSPLSIRWPLGVPLDLRLLFHDQLYEHVDPTPLMPQLALLPRSKGGVYLFDMTVDNPEEGSATVTIPGPLLVDTVGYSIELYTRREAANPEDPPVPTGLAAVGVLRLEGSGYMKTGPGATVTIPVITGPAGERGTIWTTGEGEPTVNGSEIEGDMYLDTITGDVYRFNATTGLWELNV